MLSGAQVAELAALAGVNGGGGGGGKKRRTLQQRRDEAAATAAADHAALGKRQTRAPASYMGAPCRPPTHATASWTTDATHVPAGP